MRLPRFRFTVRRLMAVVAIAALALAAKMTIDRSREYREAAYTAAANLAVLVVDILCTRRLVRLIARILTPRLDRLWRTRGWPAVGSRLGAILTILVVALAISIIFIVIYQVLITAIERFDHALHGHGAI
jgi:hypothetical protein